jgi:hypothetical protein
VRKGGCTKKAIKPKWRRNVNAVYDFDSDEEDIEEDTVDTDFITPRKQRKNKKDCEQDHYHLKNHVIHFLKDQEVKGQGHHLLKECHLQHIYWCRNGQRKLWM